MGRHGQLMSLVTINWMVKKIIGFHCRSMKRRVAGNQKVTGKNRVMMNSPEPFCRLRKFAPCEI